MYKLSFIYPNKRVTQYKLMQQSVIIRYFLIISKDMEVTYTASHPTQYKIV